MPRSTARTADIIPLELAAMTTRRTLKSALSALVASGDRDHFGEGRRSEVLTVLRQALADGRDMVRKNFEAGQGFGSDCVRQNCTVTDEVLRAIADFAVKHVYPSAGPTVSEDFDVAATGGYGRGELAPGSDIDLLFMLPYKRTARVEQIVEYILYMLWDLGLKVGHAVRSVDDCLRMAKSDITIRTAALECRMIWGRAALFNTFKKRFAKEVMTASGAAYVVSKLGERDDRHRRQGDSRYVLEPNIKESKGGLRDLQTMFWIAKYLYQVEKVEDLVSRGVFLEEEAARFAKAQNFLWTVRCHLHYLTGRPEDRLTFDVQSEIGRRLGYTDHAGTLGVERFMKHYFLIAKDVGDLTRIFCAALEAESKRPPRFNLLRFNLGRSKEIDGFRLDGERLNLRHERQFREEPLDTIRLFHVAQQNDLDIHPQALRALTRALGGVAKLRNDPEANRLFLDILTGPKDPEIALRRMNEAGVIGRFVPDFGRVVAQMQYDMYHAYTVDEHTLFALGFLHRIETGQLKGELPLASRVFHKLVSRRALYVALLLHDIAKGRGGDHSELGAKVALRLCPRLGLSPEETETVSWLVRRHLVMSATAFKRDVEDETTVRKFSELVQSPERLRLLLVLTTADIKAVGPGRWNAWKEALLGELYHHAEDMISGNLTADGRGSRIAAAQEALRLQLKDWATEEVDRFVALGYPAYWLSFDPESHARHARMAREAERIDAPLTIRHRVQRDREVTEVTFYTPDHPGLFAQLAGSLALSGANIVDARIFTMTNGRALDVFSVQDASVGGPFEAGDKLARLAVLTKQILAGQTRPLKDLASRTSNLPSRTRVFTVLPRVLIENNASASHTVIEVNGRDRPGLLYDLTRALTDLTLQISSAKVSTYGHKAIDVFYVKDVFGLKISHETKLAHIREKLIDVLGDQSGSAAPLTTGAAATERKRARRKAPPARAKQVTGPPSR
ncbi:MAG: [protein-PII] uridylyltransferase [Azospirillum sp.]|nr:[protein-PII] uridylyltransferase [Azospirillum sp.]